MLAFWNLTYNHIDEFIDQGGGNTFLETLIATLFGFLLAEGYNNWKERKRINKVARNFYAEVNHLRTSLEDQIKNIDDYLPKIDPERMEISSEGLRINAGLDTSSLLTVSKDDFITYIKRRSKKFRKSDVDVTALVKKIYLNLEISKFEFQRIQTETSNAYNESGLLTRKLEANVNSLARKFSDLIRLARREGKDVNADPFLRDLFPIFSERLSSPHPTYKALYDTLIEITTLLTNYSTDKRSDELHEPLRASFDAYRDVKRVFINLSERLKKIKEQLMMIFNNIAWSAIKPDDSRIQ